MAPATWHRHTWRVHLGHPRPNYNARVAEEIRLPTWGYEATERGELVFDRPTADIAGKPATTRLYLPMAGDTATIEIATRVKTDKAVLAELVGEAEALLIVLGCPHAGAMYDGVETTRK